MCTFDDSLTEIDWLNSLCIQNRTESKDTNVRPVTKQSQISFVTPLNSNNDVYTIPRCNGYDKPSYSYAYLIKLAIESSKNKRMKLNEIYSWITETFPYYKYLQIDNNKGWKNAIRHNLSLNKIFKRCAKDSTHLGKGSYWMIDSNFDEDIHYPPVKKLKLAFASTDSVKSNNATDNMLFSSSHIIDHNANARKGTSSRVPIISTLFSSTNINPDSIIGPLITSAPITSNSHFGTISVEAPLLFSSFTSENKPKPQLNMFSNESAFTTYSNEHHGNNFSMKISEVPQYSCEISYLEVDEDIVMSRNAKDDFIVKTPVLSQINSIPENLKPLTLETKELYEERRVEKSVNLNHYFTNSTQDNNETPFDNLSLYDSFQQPLFESESRSFELSQSTRKYLYNMSGVKETLLNRSQWLDLQDSEELQSQYTCDGFYETLRSDDLQGLEDKNNTKPVNNEIFPTKEYLELKSSLINYRYKSNVTESNQRSVSTSSTEKSSNTLKSKSDLYKKSNSFGSTSDFENLKQDVPDGSKCDGEDEIKDFFPWDSIT